MGFLVSFRSPWLITVNINLDPLVKVVFARFLYYEVSFPNFCFLKAITELSLQCRGGGEGGEKLGSTS